MSKFQQITKSIAQGISFSWGFGGMTAPSPESEVQCICPKDDEARIGYHTQVFLARALYFENLLITYEVDGDQVKISY